MWYEGPPQGVFYEGFMPPGAPGLGGGPRAQAMTISMANGIDATIITTVKDKASTKSVTVTK